MSNDRGDQIAHWFKQHDLDPERAPHVIFDDIDVGLSRFPNFVHVKKFLSESDVSKAVDMLGIKNIDK